MPLPALPANSTARVFVDYVTGNVTTSQEHTLAVRYTATIRTVDEVQADVLSVLNAMGATNFRLGWRVIRVRVQQAGAAFSLPVPVLPALAAFQGSYNTGYQARYECVEDTFQGRSTFSGRRVDISLYRAFGDVDNNFRVVAGASGFPLAVRNVVAALNGVSAIGSFLAIDGRIAFFSEYMNQNYNSYWERRVRSV